MTGSSPNALARTVRQFFATHLPSVRGVSRHTIHSYRYALILLLRFLAARHGRSVATLDLADIEAEEVLAFLDDLEHTRHNTVATRNVRLAALHAFFRYVAAHEPEQLARSQRILHIPFKRAAHRTIDYLEYAELQAVLEAVDRSTAAGRRDYALLATMCIVQEFSFFVFDMKTVTATMGAVNRTTDAHALRPPTGRMACGEFPEALRASGAVRG